MSPLDQIDTKFSTANAAHAFDHFTPSKTSGRGGFLTSLISELSGAGGAAGGAAIGTALLPGIGTIAGGALGALLGGTAGKGVENKVRDDQNFFGKGGSAKSAFTEGGLDAALSGAGEGFGVLKEAKNAAKLADLGIADAAGNTAKGTIEGVGSSLKAGSGGYGIGAKVAGQEQLDAAGSKAIDQTLKDLKINAGSPEARATALGQRIQSLGAKLSGSYAKAAAPLTEDEANAIGSRILGEVSTAPGLTAPAHDYAVTQVKNLVENHASDTSSLWDYTKNLEKNGIKFNTSDAAKIPGQEAVNRIISDNVRSTLNSKIPGLAETNSLYSKAKNAEDFLLNAAKDSGKGGSLTGRVLNLSPVKGLESKIGSATETAGKLIAGTGGPVSEVTNNLVRQTPGHILDSFASPQGNNSDQSQPDLQSALMQTSDPSLGSLGGTDTTQSQGGISQDNLIKGIQADIAQTGGKNISTILTLYKTLNEAANPTLTTAQQGTADNANYASSVLDTMLQQLGTSGGGQGRLGGLIGGVEGKLGLNNNVSAFNSTKTDAAIALAQALTGSTRVPPPSTLKLLEDSMPSITDNPQEAAQKVQILKQRLAAKLATLPGGGR